MQGGVQAPTKKAPSTFIDLTHRLNGPALLFCLSPVETPFPKHFQKTVQQIFRRLFRVFVVSLVIPFLLLRIAFPHPALSRIPISSPTAHLLPPLSGAFQVGRGKGLLCGAAFAFPAIDPLMLTPFPLTLLAFTGGTHQHCLQTLLLFRHTLQPHSCQGA